MEINLCLCTLFLGISFYSFINNVLYLVDIETLSLRTSRSSFSFFKVSGTAIR